MSKENISATVDEDVAEYLDQPGRNRSETINEAVKAYRSAAGNEKAMINLRLEQLRTQRRSLESDLENVESEIEALEDRRDELEREEQAEENEVIKEAAEKLKPAAWLRSAPKESQIPDADSEEVRSLAKKANMAPEELRDRVVTRILEEEE